MNDNNIFWLVFIGLTIIMCVSGFIGLELFNSDKDVYDAVCEGVTDC